MSKRSNGEGTIYKRKDGRWCASKHVILADGVSKRKTVYGKTQKEVKEKLKQLEDEVFPAEAGKMLLQDWMLLWMKKYKKMQLKQTTYENYEMNINTHIKGTEIGTTRLIDLTTGALQEFYIGKLKGEHGDRKISCRTVEYLHTIIGSALTQAYKNGLILKNVNDSTVLPKKEQTEITPLTVEEVKKVLEVSKSSDIHALLVVAIYTGMRKQDERNVSDWEWLNNAVADEDGGSTATFQATLTFDGGVKIDGKVIPKFVAEDIESYSEGSVEGTSGVTVLPVTVQNNTGVDIFGLYASTVDTDNWEEDILGTEVLCDGDSIVINFSYPEDETMWDFAMKDSEDNMIEFYGLDFSKCSSDGATLVLEYDGEQGYATLQ